MGRTLVRGGCLRPARTRHEIKPDRVELGPASESSYLQWFEGAQVNFQLKPVNREHRPHYDSDKENYFVFGVGYQLLANDTGAKESQR